MLRPCDCRWTAVQIAPEVESVLLRVEPDPTCRFPHRDDDAIV